ncbi:MAG: acyl-CoA dehydrogenase family protein [Acidobacteriota bacterium]
MEVQELEPQETSVRSSDEMPGDLKQRAKAAAAVAAAHADSVDGEGRFPQESFAEIKAQGLLGIMVPTELGGEGASLGDVVDICYQLGQSCSATGLIFAMHQIKVGCVVRHAKGSAAIAGILRRLAQEQFLFASSTTEGKGGGNVRSSEAPIERDGDRISLNRQATVISYGRYADGIVTTARRDADAAASDQVLTVLLKSDYTLEPLRGWDTLGMRGTCSEGFTLKAEADAGQVLPDSYEKIHGQTMVPFAHLTWGAVWAGIAAGATARAQGFLRKAARRGGQLPPGAPHFTKALSTLRTLRGLLASSLRSFESVMDEPEALTSLGFQSMITLTKVEASELATATVLSALRACGLTGYRNDSEFSIGRHLRDVLSSPIMINNDRILANQASSSLLTALPDSVQDPRP